MRGRRELQLGAVAVVALAATGCEEHDLSRPVDLQPLQWMAVGLAVFGAVGGLAVHAIRRIRCDRPRRRLAGAILTTWLVGVAVATFYECVRAERVDQLTGGACGAIPLEARPRTIVLLRCSDADLTSGSGWAGVLLVAALFYGLPVLLVLAVRWAVLRRWSVLSAAVPAVLCSVGGVAGLLGVATSTGVEPGWKVLYGLLAASSLVAGAAMAAEAVDPTTRASAAGFRAAARAR